ncbi:MAG: type II secretion system F family protein [Candidatus Pacebacteria bacterium]|nr:type II secretion system F family protein [Candidatus Paceibacterota bacterium]
MHFSYIAKSLKGKEEQGVLEAETESQLARDLKKKGLVLVFAEPEISKKEKLKVNIPSFGKVSAVDKIMFTKNLKIMISAGIALPKALNILSQQVKNNKFKQAILNVEQKVIQGETFSGALLKHSDVFPEFFSSMVKVGEQGGKLEQVLGILTKQMEREHELKSKIQGAMMYPAVIILAMLGIGVLMLVMVVPKLSATFEEFEIALPITTQFVVWLGETLASKWYLFLGLIFLSPFLFSNISKTKTGKQTIDKLVLKIPIVSPIIKKTNSAYTVRILSSLIASGVPIAKSLEILSRTLGNVFYRQAMEVSAEKVRQGSKLSDILKNYQNIYPLLVVQMIAVGEETGQTSEVLEKLADFFEEEVANSSKNLATIIEPIVMLLIGGAVGFFAISMIQPMYSMMGAI